MLASFFIKFGCGLNIGLFLGTVRLQCFGSGSAVLDPDPEGLEKAKSKEKIKRIQKADTYE
jgi:hypothetical protein